MITSRTLPALEAVLATAQESVNRYNEFLSFDEYSVDEIALLVEGEAELRQLWSGLTALGWEHFNEARDSVKTAPIQSSYEVSYTFFRHPDKPWRLEVMRMLSGSSPLHGAIAKPVGGRVCVPVHASYKVQDEEEYAYARDSLWDSGMFEAQRCDSTYGRFSYWNRLDQSDAVPYLKPRVNLRDAG